MATEIERKFLVRGTQWRQGAGVRFSQGYLSAAKERTVRVRIAGEEAFLTIKGVNRGATRLEFEYAIPLADAAELLKLCEGPIIDKIRYVVMNAQTRWEVDEFLGDNAGLVVAEVELTSEDQPFSRPGWLGREVTGDPRYYNSSLAARPYGEWSEPERAETRATSSPD
jgi:CYTH domain-containing protein